MMNGSYYLGNGTLEMRSAETPTPTGAQVLLRVRACGVCGTDVHIYHGGKGSAEVQPPVILGHELAGEVLAVGEAVTTLRPGDRVAVDPNLYCGSCRPCQTGKKQLCENMRATGVTMDGGFADHCMVLEQQCCLLDDKVPFRLGALAEPLACCLHGVDRAQIRHGDNVVVVGGGAIGLMMVQLARLAGAARVILSEPVTLRRETGLQVGADWAIDPGAQDPAVRVRELLGTDGADVVIECVGLPAAVRQAVAAAAPGATVLLFSVPEVGAVHQLDLFECYKKELTVTASFVNPDTQQRAVSLINSGRLMLEPLVTHTFPPEQLAEAIRTQCGSESIKVVVEP